MYPETDASSVSSAPITTFSDFTSDPKVTYFEVPSTNTLPKFCFETAESVHVAAFAPLKVVLPVPVQRPLAPFVILPATTTALELRARVP